MSDLAIPYQLCTDEFRFLKIRPKGKEPTGDMGGWQNKNYKFNDTELLNHLIEGGNYGIIGGFGNLILIDSDSKEITDLAETMPETFTIKTGSPEEYKKHYYFITDVPIKAIRLSKEHIGDLGDVRSVGQYVVAPNSTHPKGGKYKVIKNVPIARVSEKFVRGIFKEYIDPNESTKIKVFEPELKLRNSRFIKICNVPDYCIRNKLKGETSKNWKLFPYIVDILHNRQTSIEAYKKIVETQKHNPGAIKGWIKLAKEGKLAKSSCKKMQEYLKRFHPEDLEKVCGKCPLYKTHKKIEDIKEDKNYSELQKMVLTSIALKDKDNATELIVKEIEKENNIYTTRDDKASEMWVYKDGVYVPQGKSFVREFCRKILGETYTPQLATNVISKIEADTFINHDIFFGTSYIYEIPILNGILDIRTRKLMPFDSKKIFFNKIPILYDPSAECPEILKHFKTILRTEEDIKVILEIIGYLLLKEYKIEKAFMFVGFGRNGKSKTIELMKKFTEQVKNLGVSITYNEINQVEKQENGFIVSTKKEDYFCKKILFAMGTERKKLNIPGEKEFVGKGVSYCVTCDAFFFKGKTTGVIGGSDCAAVSALALADLAKKVYIIYRGEKLRCEDINSKRLEEKENVEIVYNTVPKAIKGDEKVTSFVGIEKGKEREIELDGVFIEIGSIPLTKFTKDL